MQGVLTGGRFHDTMCLVDLASEASGERKNRNNINATCIVMPMLQDSVLDRNWTAFHQLELVKLGPETVAPSSVVILVLLLCSVPCKDHLGTAGASSFRPAAGQIAVTVRSRNELGTGNPQKRVFSPLRVCASVSM